MEIFLVGTFSRPRFHWPLSRRLINAYWTIRAPSFMSPWNITCYNLSRNLLLNRVGLCSFTNRVLAHRRLLISDNQDVGCVFWLERHCQSWICTMWSDGKRTVIPGSFIAFEGWCAQEEAWIVGKPDWDVAPRQYADSRVALHQQLSGKTSDIRCAPSTLFFGLSPSRLFLVSQT